MIHLFWTGKNIFFLFFLWLRPFYDTNCRSAGVQSNWLDILKQKQNASNFCMGSEAGNICTCLALHSLQRRLNCISKREKEAEEEEEEDHCVCFLNSWIITLMDVCGACVGWMDGDLSGCAPWGICPFRFMQYWNVLITEILGQPQAGWIQILAHLCWERERLSLHCLAM